MGVAVGWGLARIAFRSSRRSLRLAEQGEPLLALAALVLTYGASQLVGGYGFLSVFACGMTLRAAERNHRYHRSMHEVVQRLERLLTLIILLMLGMAMTKGVLGELDWRGVVIALALVFVLRPSPGGLSLRLRARPASLPGGLGRRETLATRVLRGAWHRLALLPLLRGRRARLLRRALAVVDGRLHDPAVGHGARDARDAGHALPRAPP